MSRQHPPARTTEAARHRFSISTPCHASRWICSSMGSQGFALVRHETHGTENQPVPCGIELIMMSQALHEEASTAGLREASTVSQAR
ncbi:hypothetical protein [Glutamicibacter halophytocola]|nr:hypothetical protein [Glutamicibacter halophytocola]